MSEHIIRESQRIKQDEYVELRKAVERHRQQASAEQHAVIDECLRVMRECRAERVKQRPVVLHIADAAEARGGAENQAVAQCGQSPASPAGSAGRTRAELSTSTHAAGLIATDLAGCDMLLADAIPNANVKR
jgi:hypothetical protein